MGRHPKRERGLRQQRPHSHVIFGSRGLTIPQQRGTCRLARCQGRVAPDRPNPFAPPRVKLRHSFLAFLLALSTAGRVAAAGESIDLVSTAGHPIEYDGNTKEMVVTGGARLTYGEIVLTADDIRYQQQAGIATAHGHVVIVRGDLRMLADDGVYVLATGKLHLTNPRGGMAPHYFEGQALDGTLQEFTLTKARLYFSEPGGFAPSVSADTIHVVPGKSYVAHRAALRLAGLPLFTLPEFSQRLDEPPLDYMVRGGYRSTLGAYLDVTALAPVVPGVALGAQLGLYSNRGVMIGPAAGYNLASGADHTTGQVRSGWIYDFGHRGTDILGKSIDRQRGYFDWQHLQTVGEHLTVTARLDYWSDSEIVREFDRSRFTSNQQPDSFLEADYAGTNFVASGFLRIQPNDFYVVDRREPELRFDLLPTPLGGGFLQRGTLGFVRLAEDTPGTNSTLTSDRFDAFYALERPWAVTPWLTFTPVAGGRLTHYFTALGAKSDYTRALGEVGADLRARISGDFAVKSPRWNIDGLRHLVEPFVQYRYIPNADQGRAYIPEIDRSVFSTRLQPLDLGDIRFLDDLHPINTLRFGLDQRLQTRDAHGGARDLISLILAQDLRFARQPGEKLTSDLHADIAIAPAPWLQFDAYQRLAPGTFALRELNSGVTLTDGHFWTARFGTQYLRGDLEEYTSDVRVRLNERFAVTGRWRYDARHDLLYEHSYGLRQTFRNLWAVEYQVGWTEGELRESGFHVRLLLEVLKF